MSEIPKEYLDVIDAAVSGATAPLYDITLNIGNDLEEYKERNTYDVVNLHYRVDSIAAALLEFCSGLRSLFEERSGIPIDISDEEFKTLIGNYFKS